MARPRSFDTDTALLAAEDAFRARGYAGTSLDDIAKATGLGRGSLYAAFGDKHELFTRTIDDYNERNERAIAEELAGPDEAALERLHTFIANAGRLGQDVPNCMATKFAVELEANDPDVAIRIAKSFTAIRAALADCVTAAQRHGDIAPDADPARIADLIFAITRGMDVLSRSLQPDALAALAVTAYSALPLTRSGEVAA